MAVPLTSTRLLTKKNMIYITMPKKAKTRQITLDDIFSGGVNESVINPVTKTGETITYAYENTPQRLLGYFDFNIMQQALQEYVDKYMNLINTADKSTLYRSFKIPKKSGGLRQIDAPKDELKIALDELKLLLETKLYANHHTSAYAYIKGRSIINCLQRHQENKSRWYLKLDFHDFFGSTTPEFLKAQLKQIFPFNELYKIEKCEELLDLVFSLCFLNGGLPQGTPISPVLTNLMMIPIDYELAKTLREHVPHIVYTRYADDMLLSSELSFENSNDIYCINANAKLKKNLKQREAIKEIYVDHKRVEFDPHKDNTKLYEKVQDTKLLDDMHRWEASCKIHINGREYEFNPKTSTDEVYGAINDFIDQHINNTKVLKDVMGVIKKHNAPFTLSNHKTRYGSFNGRNWNLGLMINNKNEITVGHQKKKIFKATLFQFMTDYANGNLWTLSDVQQLAGTISYYKMVEKDATQAILDKYSEKFNRSIEEVIKGFLNGTVTNMPF